jgi:DNA-binding transcriptional ArsR family regulator
MLWSLMGGESRPGSELALIANVSPQTASAHLKLLVEAGLVSSETKGRSRFYQLNGRRASRALESLAALGPVRGTTARQAPELVFARTCYDHLAGELGVALFRSLRDRKWIEVTSKAVRITETGTGSLAHLGIPLPESRRRAAYACLDWSQRLPHLGGSLGAALLTWMLREKSLTRLAQSRAIRVTDAGRKNLQTYFGLRFSKTGRALLPD